jgi:hypothetical protein
MLLSLDDGAIVVWRGKALDAPEPPAAVEKI